VQLDLLLQRQGDLPRLGRLPGVEHHLEDQVLEVLHGEGLARLLRTFLRSLRRCCGHASSLLRCADVATVLAEVLASDDTIGHQWNVVSGDTPIAEAVQRAARTR
jgi:hypothetical protein